MYRGKCENAQKHGFSTWHELSKTSKREEKHIHKATYPGSRNSGSPDCCVYAGHGKYKFFGRFVHDNISEKRTPFFGESGDSENTHDFLNLPIGVIGKHLFNGSLYCLIDRKKIARKLHINAV